MNHTFSNWTPKEVPRFHERLVAFSVPSENRQVLLLCYNELKIMDLSDPPSVRTLPVSYGYDPFSFLPESSILNFMDQQWHLIGLEPGAPIVSRPNGQKLIVDEPRLEISVVDGNGPVWSDNYENFSDDWVAATFSPDYRYIVLGCPYDFDFRVWECQLIS